MGPVNAITNELIWLASEIVFTLVDSSATVPIFRLSGSYSVELFIDGGSAIIRNNVQEINISNEPLEQGQHTVELRKKSETALGTFPSNSPTTISNGRTPVNITTLT